MPTTGFDFTESFGSETDLGSETDTDPGEDDGSKGCSCRHESPAPLALGLLGLCGLFMRRRRR